MSVTSAEVRTPVRRPVTLSGNVQVRFTPAQHELLRDLARRLDRPISAVIRDVVTVWAIRRLQRDGETLDVYALVDELQALENDA